MKSLTDLFAPAGAMFPSSDREEIDISKGGHFGFNLDASHWPSDKSYVRQNLILLLLTAPKFMSLMDKRQNWYAALRAFVETQPSRVTGFEAGLEATVIEHAAGGGGEKQQDFTQTVRSNSSPVFEFSSDRTKNVIQRMIETWMLYGMADNNTNIPLATTLPGYRASPGSARNWLADWYSMTFIAIEPTQTMQDVVRAWLVVNSWPKGTGPITGQRDLEAGPEAPSLSFAFTGFSYYSPAIDRFARDLLSGPNGINLKNANPNTAKVDFISGVSPEVAASDAGYFAGVDKVRENQMEI